MPELQPESALPASLPAFDAVAGHDPDFALGCECADPMLQIERWQLETAQALATPDAHH